MSQEVRNQIFKSPYTLIGILNVTPDSFSDGGRYNEPGFILQRCRQMIEEGAKIIDIGGESSRPGSEPVTAEVEIERVIPVVQTLREKFPDTFISVDTCKSTVAAKALENGAHIINDISALQSDPQMAEVVRRFQCPVVLMHMQGKPRNMQVKPVYNDVVSEVRVFLKERAAFAQINGIIPGNIIVDPGIGFGKTLEHNLLLLHHLDRINELGFPVLLGSSRKSFMGTLCSEPVPANRLGGTVATTVWGFLQGVKIFRVHDVLENRQALQVVSEIQNISPSSGSPGN